MQDQLFEQFEAFMVIVDLEEDAVSHLGGVTYQMRTPDDYPLYVTFYFTYAARQIVMRAVHVDA